MPASTSHDVSPPRPGILATWLCAALGLGCPGAQVRPPGPEDCPREAREAMKELGFNNGSSFMVIVDIRQPGEQYDAGLYQDGPVVGRFVKQYMSRQFLPEGTLLHGRLWTTGISVDVYREGLRPGVIGRYTQAVLPDGRSYPVCIVMGNDDGRVLKQQGSTPELTVLGRSMPMSAVWRWP